MSLLEVGIPILRASEPSLSARPRQSVAARPSMSSSLLMKSMSLLPNSRVFHPLSKSNPTSTVACRSASFALSQTRYVLMSPCPWLQMVYSSVSAVSPSPMSAAIFLPGWPWPQPGSNAMPPASAILRRKSGELSQIRLTLIDPSGSTAMTYSPEIVRLFLSYDADSFL